MIDLYCITYNNNRILNDWFCQSLLESDYPRDTTSIFVIDNHSSAKIEYTYRHLNIKIIENSLRPNFSTGHLSRNWNQCIINGFENLNSPACDAVVCCQNDTILQKDWYYRMLYLNNNLDFYSFGAGDQLQVFNTRAIKKVGLYDERFCSIAYQEADYFLRSVLYNTEKTSINDYYHKRVHNPIKPEICMIQPSEIGCERDPHLHNMDHHKLCLNLFHKKWRINPHNWNHDNIKNLSPQIDSFIYYPYFEKDIDKDSLVKQKYLL